MGASVTPFPVREGSGAAQPAPAEAPDRKPPRRSRPRSRLQLVGANQPARALAGNPPRKVPRLFTATELAEVLRTTRKAIYSMVARNELPGVVRVGERRLLFDQDAVLAWLDERRAPSP